MGHNDIGYYNQHVGISTHRDLKVSSYVHAFLDIYWYASINISFYVLFWRLIWLKYIIWTNKMNIKYTHWNSLHTNIICICSAEKGCGWTVDRYYGQSTCSPARVALLTGRYPYRYGLQGARPILYGAKDGLPTTEKHIIPQVWYQETKVRI